MLLAGLVARIFPERAKAQVGQLQFESECFQLQQTTMVVQGHSRVSATQSYHHCHNTTATPQALNSKVVQRLEDIMNPIRGCHEQHSVEELLHHMQLQAHEDGEFTTAELVNEEKAGDCACFSVANMHTIRGIVAILCSSIANA